MNLPSHALFADLDVSLDHRAGHILCAGNSGSGKTGLLCLIARHKLRNPLTGFVAIDPDGEISPHCAEYMANPEHGLGWRKAHYLRPASQTETCAFPILHVPDRSPQQCHNKAVRALTIFEQAVTVGAGDYGPRLSKFFYMGALGLALTGRSLCDLPDLFSRGARHLREVIGSAFPYPFLTDEWQSIDLLSDRAFLEYRDPLISRLMPIFGNAHLRRVFGPQPPLDIAAVLRNREVVLLDLSGMEHKDAVLVGKAFLSLLYHEALQREPNREPHTHVMLDEAFDFMNADLARGFDRLRKRNVQLCIAIQRVLGQLKKGADDDAAATLSAVLSGTNTQLVGRLPEPDDTDLVANLLFRGFVDLAEWKQGSARPTAVGNKIEIVRSRSRAEHEAEHEAHSVTESHAVGEAVGTLTATGVSTGDFSASGDSAGLVMQAPAQLFGPSAPGAQAVPIPLTESSGNSRSSGSSEMSSTSTGTSHTSIQMHGRAETAGYGHSRGTSVTEGESETYVTQYESLPTQMFSLQEQLHRLAGEIQNLAHREFFVKVNNQRPVRTRTRDLEPAFKSTYARRVMLPIFHQKVVACSGYLFPVAEVDAQIAARLAALTPAPKAVADTKPEPLPVVDAPEQFARDFWRQRKTPTPDDEPPKPKPKRPRGRRPLGDLGPRHDRFRVVPGGKDDGDKTK